MKTESHQLSFESFVENRRSFLLLRWLIIILSAYLTLFSNLLSDVRSQFTGVFVVVVAFSLSNIVMAFLPWKLFVAARSSRLVAAVDAVFVCGFLYALRVPGPPIHLPLMGIFLLAMIWRDLRVVLFALLVVSVLFGVFSYFTLLGFTTDVPTDQFLALALFFVVAIFYVFLLDRFDRDAVTATAMLEETRNSEAMADITRTLAAFMNPDEIYREIVTRLGESMDGAKCSIVRVEGGRGVVLASASGPDEPERTIPLDTAPVIERAYQERRTSFLSTDIGEGGTVTNSIAIPMITRGEIAGVIYLEGGRTKPSSTTVQLFEVVASTVANALRNVQMFEAMKHLARTDFLTGLPNHRYFQAALLREVGRAQRHDLTLSLLIIDLDLLKTVNDKFGHPAGDSVIRSVADTIHSTCREIDLAARYGGDEFVVILPETDLPGAIHVAERLRRRIEETAVDTVGQVTASVGVANYAVNATSKEDLIRVADQALYVAKNGGGNKIAHFEDQLTTM